MATEPYIWTTSNPCGGVNNSLPDFAISDDCFSDSRNYSPDYTGQGWMIKREGISKVSTGLAGVTGRRIYSIYGGRNGTYFHYSSGIYNSAGTLLDGTAGLAQSHWCSFGAYDIFVNGTLYLKTSDGTNFTAISGIPSSTSLVAGVNNFLYAASPSNGGSLRWSDYGTVETWDATNELILGQDEGDDIYGLLETRNGLAVFCANSFYIVTGYSDINQEISYYSFADGCRSPRSIVNTPFGMFWWSKAGIAWCKEGYQIDYPMLRKLAKTLYGLNRSYDSRVHAVWDKVQQRVMFFLNNGTSQTTCNLRVDYYPQYDALYEHSGDGVNMASSANIPPVDLSASDKIYVGGYATTGSNIYLYEYAAANATDDGTAISSYLETKREGNAGIQRYGRTVTVSTDLTTAGTITYGAYVDNSTTVNHSYALTTLTGPVDKMIAINLSNKRLKHRIADSEKTRTRITQLTHTGQQSRIE